MKRTRIFWSSFSARLLSGLLFTFVVMLTSALTVVFADTNPPLLNPPQGNVYPTFSNLETAGNVNVGQFLKVGNSIQPAQGTSLSLDADKVNMTKDFEAKGKGTAQILLGENITANNLLNSNKMTFLKDVKISGSVDLQGGASMYGVQSLSTNLLNVNGGIMNAQGAAFLDPAADKDPVDVQDNLSLRGNLLFTDINDTTNEMGSVKNQHVQEWSSVLDGLLSVVGQVGTSIENVLFLGAMQGQSPTITTKERLLAEQAGKAPPDATLVVDFSTLSAEHIKAKSVGDYYFANDKPIAVNSKSQATKAAYCPDSSYQMLSCSIRYFNPSSPNPDFYPLPAPDIYKGKGALADYHIDRTSDSKKIHFCTATVWNQYDSGISFSVQATCFNPNK